LSDSRRAARMLLDVERPETEDMKRARLEKAEKDAKIK
jgi:hypothetical protein